MINYQKIAITGGWDNTNIVNLWFNQKEAPSSYSLQLHQIHAKKNNDETFRIAILEPSL